MRAGRLGAGQRSAGAPAMTGTQRRHGLWLNSSGGRGLSSPFHVSDATAAPRPQRQSAAMVAMYQVLNAPAWSPGHPVAGEESNIGRASIRASMRRYWRLSPFIRTYCMCLRCGLPPLAARWYASSHDRRTRKLDATGIRGFFGAIFGVTAAAPRRAACAGHARPTSRVRRDGRAACGSRGQGTRATRPAIPVCPCRPTRPYPLAAMAPPFRHAGVWRRAACTDAAACRPSTGRAAASRPVPRHPIPRLSAMATLICKRRQRRACRAGASHPEAMQGASREQEGGRRPPRPPPRW